MNLLGGSGHWHTQRVFPGPAVCFLVVFTECCVEKGKGKMVLPRNIAFRFPLIVQRAVDQQFEEATEMS